MHIEKNDTDTDISARFLFRYIYRINLNRNCTCLKKDVKFQEFETFWCNWNDNPSNFYFFIYTSGKKLGQLHTHKSNAYVRVLQIVCEKNTNTHSQKKQWNFEQDSGKFNWQNSLSTPFMCAQKIMCSEIFHSVLIASIYGHFLI